MNKKFRLSKFVVPFMVALFTLSVVSCGDDKKNDDDEEVDVTNGSEATNGSGVLKGHAYVDLGLPSGTKWATCNIGATKSEEFGSYFAWGEIATKPSYTPANLNKDLNDEATVLQSNGVLLPSTSKVTGQNVGTLTSDYDAATILWGADWKLPTVDEMEELYRCCTNKWTDINGVKGRLFTASNGEILFLPAAGHKTFNKTEREGTYGTYWTSTGYNNIWSACNVFFTSETIAWNSSYYRYDGQNIRPVLRNK